MVKIKNASNEYYVISVKRKAELEEEDNGSINSAVEDLEDLQVDENFLTRNSLEDNINQIMGDENQIDTKIFTPMNKEEFDYTKVQNIMLRKGCKEDDVFIMKKALPSEVQDILFIHSCIPIIK